MSSEIQLQYLSLLSSLNLAQVIINTSPVCFLVREYFVIEIVWLLEYDIMIFYRDCLAAGI
jgi:hypothetical protein